MWRKRLHMDIVILPLVRNLAFTLFVKRWRGCGSASSSCCCRFSQKKTKKNNTSKDLAFEDVVSKVRTRLARGPCPKSDVESVLCIWIFAFRMPDPLMVGSTSEASWRCAP